MRRPARIHLSRIGPMLALAAVLFGGLDALATAAPDLRPKIVAYVPNWRDLHAYSETIEYAKLTHINIAFENPTNDDGDISFQPRNAAVVAKARASRVKVLISLGGGAASTDPVLMKRYFDLLTEGRRTAFIARIVDYIARYDFDGVDVDLEGPAINADYGPLLRDLSAALRPRGKLLTAALSRGYGGAKVPDAALGVLDFLNVMAYDGAGHWNPDRPGQHASMELARRSVAYWLERGVPRTKVVLGVPFYGYGFGEAFQKRGYSYAAIVAAHPGAELADQAGKTIWYNGIPTIRAKSQYVLDEGLGGIMIWSLDNDAKGDRSLLAAIYGTLTANLVTRSLPRLP